MASGITYDVVSNIPKVISKLDTCCINFDFFFSCLFSPFSPSLSGRWLDID